MAQASIEKIILQNLVMNEPFARKVVPFLKKEYFHDRTENFIFVAIQDFII